MKVSRVVFITDSELKERAEKRARARGTDLKTVLSQALYLYSKGLYHPENFSKGQG